MKKLFGIFILLMACFAVPAFAFSWNPVNWVRAVLDSGGYTILAYILTGVLGLAVFGTIFAVRVVQTLKETGELLIALSDALADKKITSDEIKAITADVRDVVSVWKTTPPAYVPGAAENTNPPEK